MRSYHILSGPTWHLPRWTSPRYPLCIRAALNALSPWLCNLGSIIVVENVFHYRQVIPLEMGDNVFGFYVRGTNINKPIETVDPSVNTKHCIIRVQRNKRGDVQYILRDAPSNTSTFYMNDILKDQDRIRLSDSDIITIGATTLILRTKNDDENE